MGAVTLLCIRNASTCARENQMFCLTKAGLPSLVFLLGLFVGCDKTQVKPAADKVSGTVWLDDKIVNYGNVVFRDEAGNEKKVVIFDDGTYSIPNPPPGELKIMIRTGVPRKPLPAVEGRKSQAAIEKIEVPTKYSDPETTDLKITVVPGQQTFDIHMVSETKKKDKKS